MPVSGHADVDEPRTGAASLGTGTDSRRQRWKMPILIVGAGGLSYLNSFQGDFVFDDRDLIVNNSYIRQLWPPWPALFAPINVGRPLVSLTTAVNYALSGLNPWSYHALNLIIHVLAGLTLFGIVSRTLRTEKLSGRFGGDSTSLALATALIWVVHPLQTQSVTYIIQRGESLAGLFYLVTLYCSMRGFWSSRSGMWHAAAIGACALGMLSKQMMVTAPLMVLLYDLIFAAGSPMTAIRGRWKLYVGLAGTWGILAATMIAAPPYQTAGFAVKSISSWEYFTSEFQVIIHYLRLTLWPNPLCLDYGWAKSRTAGEIIPAAVIVGALQLATIFAVVRRKPSGFVGAWFFGILSVTSTFVPIADLAFEHRMYLPLASVVVLVVLGCYSGGTWFLRRYKRIVQNDPRAAQRVALAAITSIVVLLGFLTLRRNIDYRSAVVMWRDVVKKRPDNPRGHNNLGEVLAQRDDMEGAIVQFSEALKLEPGSSDVRNNLGLALAWQGRLQEAKHELIEALQINSGSPHAHLNLARVLTMQGELDGAMEEYSRAVQLKPDLAEAHLEMGRLLQRQGRTTEAKQQIDLGVQLGTDLPAVRDQFVSPQ